MFRSHVNVSLSLKKTTIKIVLKKQWGHYVMHITKNMKLNNFMISGAKAESRPLLMIPIRSLKVPQLRIIMSSQNHILR